EFVLYMQREDGRFHNFIRDWDGTINTDGPTSYAGATFWQARAVRALAKAHLVFRGPRVASPLARGFAFATQHPAPPDVRAIQVFAALDPMHVGLTPVLRETLERWCDEIAECRDGDVLFNAPGEPTPVGLIRTPVPRRTSSAPRLFFPTSPRAWARCSTRLRIASTSLPPSSARGSVSAAPRCSHTREHSIVARAAACCRPHRLLGSAANTPRRGRGARGCGP